MPAPKDTAPVPKSESLPGNSVEKSLEDFIARANTTLAPSLEALPQVRAIGTRRRKALKPKENRPPATLVVLGPRGPLAEETEIVTRFSPEDLLPRRKSWFSLRLGLAFVAGAAMVLVATRLMSGGPRPVRPSAPAPVAIPAPAPAPPPPIVVQPIPQDELPAPPPTAAPPAPEPVVAKPPAAVRPATPRKPRSVSPKAPPREPAAKKPSGLVDPFAN